jgi:single-stranded-DNA-specific exonuclease
VQRRAEDKVIPPQTRSVFTRQSRWIILPPEPLNDSSIAWSEFCGCKCIARLLLRKGFNNADEVRAFLKPQLKTLSDPFLLPNMKVAVARILASLDRRERIVLFGDYDVDGVTSLALLAEMLRAYGAEPDLFLPLRMEEGYGLSSESVERCVEQHRPQLLIALDCGTSSATEIVELHGRGVDVIVVDHHEPKSGLPECVAIVNPKTDPASAFHYLCTAGIVFKLCHALLKARPAEFDLKSKLDLVALATVADIVPLRGENRTFVQRGAIEIARATRPGLKKLIAISGVKRPICTEDIGYRLGPRLNAAGRLSTAEKSLRLLLTQNESEATELAEFLDKQNRERQEVEKQIFAAAEEKIAKEFDPSRDAALVVSERGWHAGVLGIVASRIARKYHRPAIVIGVDESGVGKGSGRSIEGLNLVQALNRCADKLEKYGGHEMAAGLTIQEKDVDVFAEEFRRVARELLSDDDLLPRLRLDDEISFAELNYDFLGWHEMLQPFGNCNPQPLFFARGVESVVAPRVVGENHLALVLRQQNYQRRAIFFGAAENSLPAQPWDIAFRIRPDEYEGETRLEIRVEAVRESARVS